MLCFCHCRIFQSPKKFLQLAQKIAPGQKGESSESEEQQRDEVERLMFDMIIEAKMVSDLADRNPGRELEILDDVKVILVGANHASKFAAHVAGNVVAESRPSALCLELCSERLDGLIVGNDHLEAKKKNLMNPDEPEEVRRRYEWYGDETRQAFRAFMECEQPHPRLLVLADLKSSQTDDLIFQYGKVGCEEIQGPRDKNIAIQILSAAALGHKTIVAVLGAAHLDGASENLTASFYVSACFPRVENSWNYENPFKIFLSVRG